VFGRLAINSGIACMLDWLKRKSTSSAPSAQLLESEEQPPLTDERLGRMLGRLGSDSRTRSEPAAEVLNRIDPLPGTDGRAAGEPAAEALNEIDQPPSADSGTAGEPAAQALNEVDQPPSADNRAESRATLSHAELTISRRGHGPSAAELLAKGYSFAAGPDGKMLVFDAAGHQVDTAQPSSNSTAASEPAAEAVSEIAPQPSIDSVAASEPAAEAVSEIAPQPSTDSVAASEPAAKALNEIAPLPRARKRTFREPSAEASNEINPPPRADSKAGGAPGKMVVIAVSSQKGGSGKTTIAAHLAVRAGAAGHGPVVLIDTDPQGSLAEWWQARADETPVLATVKPEELAANLAELRSYGTAIAIIDTPPALTGSIEQVIAMADLILIPVRPSPHDLRAAGGTVELARKAGKPFMFIVNSASPRASITAQAVAALSEHGRVAPVILYQRTEYAASMIDGRTVTETAGSGRSAQEIAELWQCVYAQIGMRVAA
jgi:chromosome partitioning protein